MSAKWDFRFGREVTYAPGVTFGHRKRGFRITDIGRNALHCGVVGMRVGNHDTSRITTQVIVGKSRNS
jgi:hypothetical protein